MSTRRMNVNIAKPKLGNRERRSPRRTKTPSSNELKNKYIFSPKGKRKLDFPLKSKKGPLSGKLFYLDIPSSRVNQLKTTIERLGGIVEEFFRREVTYLVTSRGECGKSPSSQSVPSPGTPSPIPLTRSSSIKSYAAASPMSTDSPQSVDTPQTQASNGTTRGKSIAKRSASYTKGSTDILSHASTWGVNIVHVDQVLKWISQLKLKAQQHDAVKQKISSPSKRVAQSQVPKVVGLQETYIKVEDLEFKYRPLIHEFKVWPELTFYGSNVCPFDPPRRRSSENRIIKKERGNETKSVRKPPMHERPKDGYCECCEVRYADLDTHLKGKQHRDFARKDSNYISLDKAINEGPQVGHLLNEIQLRKSNSSPDVASVEEKTSLQADRCLDTEDTCNDDVFLLSTPPRSSRRNKINISDHTPPSKENRSKKARSNESKQKKTSPVMNADHNNVQKTNSVSKPCTPEKMMKKTVSESSLSVIDSKQESPQSRPLTRLQKASSNSSSPCENKHLLSVVETSKRESCDKTASVLKNSENERHSKTISGKKRKSTEVTEECNELEVLECSNNSRDNMDDTILNDGDNEHSAFRRSTRESNSSLSLATKKENQCEAEVQLSQDEHNSKSECRNKISERNPRKIWSKNVVDQSDKGTATESVEQIMTSQEHQHEVNKFLHPTGMEKENNHEKDNESKRRKRKSVIKLDVFNQTSALKKPMPGDNTDESMAESLERNQKTIAKVGDNSVIVGSKASDEQEENKENHNLEKGRGKHDKVNCDISDTEGDIQRSDDLPCLKIPSKNVSNNGCLLAICPGALIEAENTPTVRSSRRRKSLLGNCKLSPILPFNLDGEYSIRSSCSGDTEFLPSGLRIYSSFGSAMGVVSNSINFLVDRIEEEFTTDGAADNEKVIDPNSNTPSDYGEILNKKDARTATSLEYKDVFPDIPKVQIENTELQVSLSYLNVDAICSARGEDGDSNVNVKRKRKINDDEEPSKARKYKRLSVADDASDFQQDDFVESLSNGNTSEVQQTYRSSVAERVKLNRAILESLQECNLSTVDVLEPASSPQVQPKCQKRKNVLLSSPFAEITNTCKKKRERAKSEGKIRTRTRSLVHPVQNGSQQPRSACFSPNDPFRFDDY